MIPYSRNVRVEAESGVDNPIELPAPDIGTLVRLVVYQSDSTAAGFTVDIYDSEYPSGDTVEDDYSEVDDELTNDTHAIMPTMTVNAASRKGEFFEKRYSYESNEMRGAIRKTALFMNIVPAGTGTKTFDIGYTIEIEDL